MKGSPTLIRTFVLPLTLTLLTLVSLALSAVAWALPEDRAYEQVSPEFKAGYPVFVHEINHFALDGESAEFTSIGTFSGSGENTALNTYVARRSDEGWVTSALWPSEREGQCWVGLEEMSPELSRFEYLVEFGSSAQATMAECSQAPMVTVGFRELNGSLVQPLPVMATAGGVPFDAHISGSSFDLSHLVMTYQDSPPAHIITSDKTQLLDQLMELREGEVPRLIGVDNTGKQLTRYCSVELGGPGAGSFGAVSQPEASEVFFSTALNTYSSTNGYSICNESATHPIQLFVRVAGEQTLTVSAPLPGECTEEPCKSAAKATPREAVFQGASEDGARVFFTSTQSLVNADKDESNDLYMATIGCANGAAGEHCGSEPREVTSLTEISHDPYPGQSAEVEPKAVAISPDGSHVYFVARGVLSEGANNEGETPVLGAENLYVYDVASERTDKVAFIAGLCSGPEESGTTRDPSCPGGLTASNNDAALWMRGIGSRQEAQTISDGGFLVFSTYAQLIRSGPEADTDSAKDVYRYDAYTGRLQRVSIGEVGYDGNGNNSAFDANIAPALFRGSVQEQYQLSSRAITENGSTIVFTTSEPLSASATSGQQDVYVWHEGSVGLISSGSATEPDTEPVITPSGRDIFFSTSAGLVSGDTDGLRDIYDARIGGGFPVQAVKEEECVGDACLGPLSAPAPVLVAGSVSQSAGDNLPAPAAATPKVTMKKAKTKKKKKRGSSVKKSGRAHKSTRRAAKGRRGR